MEERREPLMIDGEIIGYIPSDPWRHLRKLMSAVDSHRLVNGERSEQDEKLYETVRAIRMALR